MTIWLALILPVVALVLWFLFRSGSGTISEPDDDDDLGALL
jgi:hypothetical protein